MLPSFKKVLSALPVFMAALVLCASVAFAALTVESAKSQGLIGERTNGMIGIVSVATPELTQLVTQTNAQRLEKYKAIAEKRGVDINQIEAYAGKKLIGLAAPGEYVMNAAGGWIKK